MKVSESSKRQNETRLTKETVPAATRVRIIKVSRHITIVLNVVQLAHARQ